MSDSNYTQTHVSLEEVAANGLHDRRLFLKRSFVLAGMTGLGGAAEVSAAQHASREHSLPESMKVPGATMTEYGQPSPFAKETKRRVIASRTFAPQIGISLTPLEKLRGTITPNGLHFERHHSGTPRINPNQHDLKIHGLVKKAQKFSYDDLMRYPMSSSFYFIECSGNGFRDTMKGAPIQESCGFMHGLVSNAEWTGIKLSVLLDEVGLKPDAKWLIAEGADAASLVRSIPLDKAIGDTMLALFQNGEPIRPEQGYPMRLLVPGWEGNMNVKWVHNIRVASSPAHSRSETSRYTDLLEDGSARQFTFPMGVKSVITHPSAGLKLPEPGFYELAGIAWTGHGTISKVEISADAGNSWADAELNDPLLPMSLTRFRIPWRWNGRSAILQSRAYDDAGNIQPTRDESLSQYKKHTVNYHFNGIQSWEITSDGHVKNIHV